ncbi:hypothetical protein PVAND_016498 [Polypedilum vanderplanki]|uniref:Uncharacterized protein n=1 Tax=Polypedilum vanderplanki TaxID=319348 RepID=A0A9J6BFZ3_POLVA|nr:hypothetical protein PVAND_016498 [Polypedilum vanderplanki]
MKLCLKQIFYILIFTISAESLNVKFHKIENCTASGKSAKIEKCEIDGNFLLLVVDILKPINKAFLTFQMNPKDLELFSNVIKPIPIEWCSFMKTQKSNRITKVILESISKSIPQLFQQCPLKDKLNLKVEFSGKMPLLQMMPFGIYQFYLKTHNDDENPIFEMTVLLKIDD